MAIKQRRQGPRSQWIIQTSDGNHNLYSDIMQISHRKFPELAVICRNVQRSGRSRTLICLTPQLTSLFGWYRSHDMSNICGEKTSIAMKCWLSQTPHDHICIILLIYVTLHRNYQRLCRKKGQDIKITEEIKRHVYVCLCVCVLAVL